MHQQFLTGKPSSKGAVVDIIQRISRSRNTVEESKLNEDWTVANVSEEPVETAYLDTIINHFNTDLGFVRSN